MDRRFRITCSDEEKPDLLKAVEYLDSRMREIRDSSKVIGVERIAIMAALNISHELLSARVGSLDVVEFQRKMRSMAAVIDETLAAQNELF